MPRSRARARAPRSACATATAAPPTGGAGGDGGAAHAASRAAVHGGRKHARPLVMPAACSNLDAEQARTGSPERALLVWRVGLHHEVRAPRRGRLLLRVGAGFLLLRVRKALH